MSSELVFPCQVPQTGQGLFECFEKAMEYMKVEAWKSKMIVEGGFKGLLQHEVLCVLVPFSSPLAFIKRCS